MTQKEVEVYVFSEDADYARIREFKKLMPSGLRYAAYLTGPWCVFGILEMDDLAKLPDLLNITGLGSETDVVATHRLLRVLKRSHYHPVSAFVRIDIDAHIDPEGEGTGREEATLLGDIRRKAAGDGDEGEAESVMGAFDSLAYVGGTAVDDLTRKVGEIRKLDAVRRTLTMRVIDWVSPNAPEEYADHRPEGIGEPTA